MIAWIGSSVCLGLFILHDPWAINDGAWLLHLADALPYFLLAPMLAVYAAIVPGSPG